MRAQLVRISYALCVIWQSGLERAGRAGPCKQRPVVREVSYVSVSGERAREILIAEAEGY